MEDKTRWGLLRVALGKSTIEEYEEFIKRKITEEEMKYYLETKKQIDRDKETGVYEKTIYYATSD